MGQMLIPALVGAGVGAAGSAAMGKSPLTGALLGASVGGLGGAGGLFGGAGAAGAAGATGATTGIQLAQAPILEGLSTSLAPTVVGGSGAAGITGLGSGTLGGAGITGLGSGTLGAGGAGITGLNTMGIDSLSLLDPSRLAYNTPLSFGEKLSNVGSSGYSYLKDNPATALSGVNSLSNASAKEEQAKQQRLNEAVATGAQPIQRKQFDPSSAIAAAPSYGLSREEVGKGKIAQIASQARLNDEDERKIGQFYQSLIG
jgi:hypothetical protein